MFSSSEFVFFQIPNGICSSSEASWQLRICYNVPLGIWKKTNSEEVANTECFLPIM